MRRVLRLAIMLVTALMISACSPTPKHTAESSKAPDRPPGPGPASTPPSPPASGASADTGMAIPRPH